MQMAATSHQMAPVDLGAALEAAQVMMAATLATAEGTMADFVAAG